MRKRTGKLDSSHVTDEQAADANLEDYRRKRDPLATTEPFAPERPSSSRATRNGVFVVHLHHATRVHYDVRLQIGGTLKSFAVPKGPSLRPLEKRLAMLTEDHPLEYLDFEDVIPAGNYGAGPMIVWDRGQVQYLETSAEEGLVTGKLDFLLHGYKLHGRFALVGTGQRKAQQRAESGQIGKDNKNEWLLIKKTDAHSREASDIIVEAPRSVLSGMTIDELRKREDVASRLVAQAAQLGSAQEPLEIRNTTPMLCATSGATLLDATRLYELKIDGVRILAEKSAEGAWLRYRSGLAGGTNYPEIVRAVRALAPAELVLDGEIVAFDDAGRPSFQRLGPRMHARRHDQIQRARAEIPVVFVVFDLLRLGEYRLTAAPLRERKRLLMQLVQGSGLLRALDHIEGDGRPLYELCRAEGLEGVVAKRSDSPYRPGPTRTDDWVKIKCERDEDFVVIGWTEGNGSRQSLGALHVASYSGSKLVFRGKVGSGLDEAEIGSLLANLEDQRVASWPLEEAVPEDVQRDKSYFVAPELVVRVRFHGFTDEGRLRAPVYLGLRVDVDPQDCTAAPHSVTEETLQEPALLAEPPAAPQPTHGVTISNQNKVFWPREGYTKGDLCAYYAAVSPAMLPFLRGRPVTLVRYPDGIEGKNFYQWRAPAGTPDWIRTLDLRRATRESSDEAGKPSDTKEVFLIDSVDALVHIANLGCIPIHVLAKREDSLDECDFLTIDFDLGEQPLSHAIKLAFGLRELLTELGLCGYPKTSGQKGLHVLIPVGPGIGFPAAKLLIELLGRLLAARFPELATMERRVSKRGPRVYVDTGQTGPSRTIVAPYSVRAYPGASVSTPLFWEELHLALEPAQFSLATVPARLAEIGDPMASLLADRPRVVEALTLLEALLRQPLG